MTVDPASAIAEKFATDFISRLDLGTEPQHKCEWSCILWSKDHWASEAQRAQVNLQQAKGRTRHSGERDNVKPLLANTLFLNTVAQVHSKLFDPAGRTCSVKTFRGCPFMNDREDLLRTGNLAGAFVTILHKATMYSMLDDHPLDSGLLDEQYGDVYGIDLTSYEDLERSLRDGRFEKLYETTVRRARQLTGTTVQSRAP